MENPKLKVQTQGKLGKFTDDSKIYGNLHIKEHGKESLHITARTATDTGKQLEETLIEIYSGQNIIFSGHIDKLKNLLT